MPWLICPTCNGQTRDMAIHQRNACALKVAQNQARAAARGMEARGFVPAQHTARLLRTTTAPLELARTGVNGSETYLQPWAPAWAVEVASQVQWLAVHRRRLIEAVLYGDSAERLTQVRALIRLGAKLNIAQLREFGWGA